MKKIKFLLLAACSLMATATMAQDFSAPQYAKWGDTPADREKNILNSNYLKEACENKDFNAAAGYLKALLDACPAASENIYVRGTTIYKNKIARAKGDDRKVYIDSLMLVYDLRLQYFGNHAKRGTAYILDRKAREFLTYCPNDRAGIRAAFCAAIEAGGEKTDPETIVAYFSNLCEDYKNADAEVLPDVVIAEYDRLGPVLEANPSASEYKSQFDAAFGLSGAANCENLEKLFRAKLAAAPGDEAVLAQAVSLMSRAKCDSQFYFDTTEEYYKVKPSSETALFLAQAFQNKGDYAKAMTYLKESLEVEQNPAERQKLYCRIALIGLVSNNMSSALSAAREARDLNPEDGVPYFVIAQCYASSAAGCGGFAGSAVFWVAYDTMAKALELLPADSEYVAPAKTSLGAYASRFPTSEECFFNELKAGSRYTVTCGLAAGQSTSVRPR